MRELPRGWVSAPLDALACLKTGPFGSALHKSDYIEGGIPIVNPIHIRSGRLSPGSGATVSLKTAERLAEFRLKAGDVVIGRRGEMGRCAVVQAEQAGWLCGTGSLILRPADAIHPSYLQRFLSSPDVVHSLEGESVGSTMVNLNQGILKDLIVPIPPYEEQIRIAQKLEDVETRILACRKRLEAVPEVLKRFREAVLEAAVSGRLTEEWRGCKDLTGWRRASIDELCAHIFDGPFGSHLKSADYSDRGVRVVRLENVGHLRFFGDQKTYIPKRKYQELAKHSLHPNDIVFSSFIDEEVRVCLIPADLGMAINKADCFCLRSNLDLVLPGFLSLRLACVRTYEDMKRSVHGATRPRINLRQLRSYQLNLPPTVEQAEIVRRVGALFELAHEVDRKYGVALKNSESIASAALAVAFRGELVQQDPGEKASEQDVGTDPGGATVISPRRGRNEAGVREGKWRQGREGRTRKRA